MFGDVVNYFGSEWSFAKYHCSEPNIICAFGAGSDKHSIIGNFFFFFFFFSKSFIP